jgi:hypothetical protein
MEVHELYGPYGDSLTRARKDVLARTVVEIKRAYQEGREFDCYMQWESITELEEQLWMQLQLEAPIREAIKRFQRAERAYDERQRDISDE